MRRLLLVAAALAGLTASAARRNGFGTEAFWACVPTGQVASVAFSPVAYELDCAAISELFDPIRRAAFAEAVGAMTGWQDVYDPIRAQYAGAVTNGLQTVSARALLMPRLKHADADFRVRLMRDYAVTSCPLRPSRFGAECWLRTTMEGQMEDIVLDPALAPSNAVSFVDFESVRFAFLNPLSGTGTVAFAAADGRSLPLPAVTGEIETDLWETERFTCLRLPLAASATLNLLLPAEGVTVDGLRGELDDDRLERLRLAFLSVSERGVSHDRLALTLPRLEFDSRLDLLPAFARQNLSLDGMTMVSGGALAAVHQRLRLSFNGSLPPSELKKAPVARSRRAPRPFAVDRPFVFFVYHEPTRTIPAMGVFTGCGE